ncbi:MAG: hypothetical protein ACTHZX_08535 [Microbacterium sp.]
MANAAHELATKLAEWRVLPARQSLNHQRGIDPASATGWRDQMRLTELLREVDRYLAAADAAGRDVSHYLRAYPQWAKAIFAPGVHWNQSTGSATAIGDAPAIDLLRALGDIMDAQEISVSLSEETTRESLGALDELLECLNDPSVQLSEIERRYVFELIGSVRRVFEESEVLGSVDMLRRVHELIGVLSMLADTLDVDEATRTVAKRIKRAARRVAPYVAFGGKATAGAIGVAADLIQITSG